MSDYVKHNVEVEEKEPWNVRLAGVPVGEANFHSHFGFLILAFKEELKGPHAKWAEKALRSLKDVKKAVHALINEASNYPHSATYKVFVIYFNKKDELCSTVMYGRSKFHIKYDDRPISEVGLVDLLKVLLNKISSIYRYVDNHSSTEFDVAKAGALSQLKHIKSSVERLVSEAITYMGEEPTEATVAPVATKKPQQKRRVTRTMKPKFEGSYAAAAWRVVGDVPLGGTPLVNVDEPVKEAHEVAHEEVVEVADEEPIEEPVPEASEEPAVVPVMTRKQKRKAKKAKKKAKKANEGLVDMAEEEPTHATPLEQKMRVVDMMVDDGKGGYTLKPVMVTEEQYERMRARQ